MVPRQLPFSPSGFVDRVDHLRDLDVLAGGTTCDVPIAVISGPPGVGKSALALYWAHRMRARFPGGDLYAHMHGHAPGPRTETAQVLDSFLRALGVSGDRIPLDLDGRASLFRSELSGRRMLVVIDDVLGPAQVRPLLPASPGCMVIVTSRSSLSGLVSREGARRLSLDVLAMDDSVELLRRTVGTRVDEAPEEARRIAEHCARLPLALRVAAERLTDRRDVPLSDLVSELSAEESRLDALSEEDELSDLRAVMASSYAALDDDTARFFRLLGLHPGAEFSAAAAAALADVPQAAARRFLERLVRAHLVERTRPDRYRLHDLVRLYAAERTTAEDGPATAGEVAERAARWYTHAACRAQQAAHPHFPVVPGAEPSGQLPEFGSPSEALTWFEQERTNLLAALDSAHGHGHHDIAWRLAASVYPLFERHRHWDEWRGMQVIGLRSAELAGSSLGLARNHLGLGDALWLLGDVEEAAGHYRAALGSGEPWVEGFALRQLALLSWQRGERGAEVIGLVERAVTAFREAGERRGEAMCLLSLAEFAADTGDFQEALVHVREAVRVFTEIGNVWSVAWGRCTLGRVLAGLGRFGEAREAYRAAEEVFADHGDQDSRTIALFGLGDAHLHLGEPEQAREALGAALDHLRDHGDPRAAEVEERLSGLATGG
nr:tetratricopeptide repeat protein [Nocardiopsis algeriensis]